MSAVIDCPHCHVPLSSMMVAWTAQCTYSGMADIVFERRGVIYKARPPHQDTHPSHGTTDPGAYVLTCPKCSSVIDPETVGWHIAPHATQEVTSLFRGFDVIRDADKMEDLL